MIELGYGNASRIVERITVRAERGYAARGYAARGYMGRGCNNGPITSTPGRCCETTKAIFLTQSHEWVGDLSQGGGQEGHTMTFGSSRVVTAQAESG